MTWEFYPATTMFSTYAEEWDRLNAQLYDSHPLFDSRFVGPLLDYFGSGNEKLCICRVNGVIEGALILRPSGAGRWSSFLPSQAQVAPVLLSDASRLGALLRELPGFAWTIEFLAIDPRYSPGFFEVEPGEIVSPHAHTIGIDRGIRFVRLLEGPSEEPSGEHPSLFQQSRKRSWGTCDFECDYPSRYGGGGWSFWGT